MKHLAKVLFLSSVSIIFGPSLYAGDANNSKEVSDTLHYSYTRIITDDGGSDTSDLTGAKITIETDDSVTTRDPDFDRINPPDVLARQGKNAIYLEILGNSLNLVSLNYERMLSNKLFVRLGGSYFGFSRKFRYEGDNDDLFIDLYSVPASVSITLLEGIRQIELGAGATLFSFSFWGGSYDVGYHDIELGNQYMGLALTTIVGYRVSIKDYLFRFGLSPYYMITLDSELSGFFEEMEDRGIMEFHDWLDFRGFRVIPGLSFGRSF